MVTAENGSVSLKGLTTGKVYTVDIYIDDVVANPVLFNPNGLAVAGSAQFYKIPAEDCMLVDISIATGNTVTKALLPTQDGNILPGRAYRIANFLNTLTNRPPLGIRYPAGSNFGFIEA
jgi:hypothetical protein